ncbi:MAG: metal-dependent hydrolase [Candidatus Bathyarchaeota archaeon]|nr:metal-dependent hydrolase [Candidatus Bathyarchaeota archaeon]
MFAIGHFALAYLSGKSFAAILKTRLNLPLLFMLSILPDVDLILQFLDPALFMHRGAAHSIFTFTAFFIPFLVFYRKKAVPYYVALLSHSMLGDLFTGGFEMLWPLSENWFSFMSVDGMSFTAVAVELSLFTVALPLMFKTNDIRTLLKVKNHNLALIIPFGAVLGPMLQLGQGTDMSLPVLLVAPSLFCLCVFAYSMMLEVNFRLNKLPA